MDREEGSGVHRCDVGNTACDKRVPERQPSSQNFGMIEVSKGMQVKELVEEQVIGHPRLRPFAPRGEEEDAVRRHEPFAAEERFVKKDGNDGGKEEKGREGQGAQVRRPRGVRARMKIRTSTFS